MIRIIFFGTHTLATTVLNELINAPDIQILAVVTQPDKPAGRGNKVESPLIKKFAEQHRLPVLQFQKLKNEAVEQLQTLDADLFVVAEYGLLIPPSVLALPPHGVLNVHPSLLPKYRGASPVQSAILNGDTETGVSIMLLDAEMDHGPILAQEQCLIDGHDTAPTLEAKLGRLGAALLIKAMPDWVAGKIKAREQNHAQATFCKKLTRDDGHIDWSKSAEEIYRMWRAYLPWPGVFTMWNGKRVKIVSCHPERSEAKPSEVEGSNEILRRAQNDGVGTPFFTPDKNLAIACGFGVIIVERLQLEGKKELDTPAFLRGYPAFVGTKLG